MINKEFCIFLDAFPKKLEDDVKVILTLLNNMTTNLSIDNYHVKIKGETVVIPYRIYIEEPKLNKEMELTKLQKQILDCLFTRHHDGYIRQKRLNNIFSRGNVEDWIIPYIMKLVGEYVVEIIDDIYINIELIDAVELKNFIAENDHFIKITEDRILSYWNEYYRTHINKEKYTGFKMKEYIEFLI